MPRTDGAEPNENGDIEQQINARLQAVVLRFDPEPIVPGEYVSSHETGENIIAADKAFRPDDEKLPDCQIRVRLSNLRNLLQYKEQISGTLRHRHSCELQPIGATTSLCNQRQHRRRN